MDEVMAPLSVIEEIIREERNKAIRMLMDATDMLSLGYAQGWYKLSVRLLETLQERLKERKVVLVPDGLRRQENTIR